MATPAQGAVVHCRSHRWLVEEVEAAEHPEGDTVVRLACLDDDANGQRLEVFWQREVDALVLGETTWDTVGQRGFDDPQVFGSYLNTLRWNCVTSTDPGLFQAPLRAGIDVKPYQLEPLRKALRMPRVSLFIADDVGLGKTIEAGLIMRELLLRQKVHRVVVVAPPSVVLQWKGEMESRFGLSFAVMDRQYITEMRRQRGWGINPWATHSRFILSQALVRDEAYAGPLRDWLGQEGKQALLILDEAHNAAPASGSKFAIDSKLTRAIRDLAGRFEHKLFLSATPHNGHSNSFSALLEILDPTRFCRGVPVRKQDLEDVMVRRLKEDLRQIGVELPERLVVPEVIDGLPTQTPELRLAELLSRYREQRNQRLAAAGKRERAAEKLVIANLQKRLLSSIAAFDRTLQVHCTTLSKRAGQESRHRPPRLETLDLLADSIDGDDERAEGDEEELLQEADAQHEAAVRSALQATEEDWPLLGEMQAIAEAARYEPDSRVQRLEQLIRAHLCPRLGQDGAAWAGERLLIFTEYADTKDWLERRVRELIAGSDQAESRLATFHGGIGDERREAIKRSFNSPPAEDPLRILIATDAAREGVNLQMDVLVRKTEVIRQELGSLSPLVQRQVDEALEGGIDLDNVEALQGQLLALDSPNDERSALLNRAREELEASRRMNQLKQEQETLRQLLAKSQDWLAFDEEPFRQALNCSLELLGVQGLEPHIDERGQPCWRLSNPEELAVRSRDVSWETTLDSLRGVKPAKAFLSDWRRENPVRPLIFSDPGRLNAEAVHLHLEHRLVQRLLSRFLSQGFLHHELSRACVLPSRDPQPRVIVLGRLSLFGQGAARLHDELITVMANWHPGADRSAALEPLNDVQQQPIWQELRSALTEADPTLVSEGTKAQLQAEAPADVEALLPVLQQACEQAMATATELLKERGASEAEALKSVLRNQRQRIRKTLNQRTKELSVKLSEAEAQQMDVIPGLEEMVVPVLDARTLSKQEERQLRADQKHWQRRLEVIEAELSSEPKRISDSYRVITHRLEPAGLVYLWPISG